MLKLEREIDHIETVGDLRAALANAPDEMPICDSVGEALLVGYYRDMDTGDISIEIG